MELFPYVQLSNLVATKEDAANRGVADGYAALDSNGRVPLSQIPTDVTGLINTVQLKSEKDQANGYAALDAARRIATNRLPANVAELPARVGVNETNISTLFNQVSTKANKSQTMPAGGTTGQLLTKASATDYAASWQDPPEDLPASMVHMQFRDSSFPYNWPSRVTVAGHVMWVDLTDQPMSDPADWQVGDLIFDPS